MARVFLDVGSHHGQSIEIALDPRYGFDRVVGFEPVAECRTMLELFVDPRVEVRAFGLGAADATVRLYAPGGQGGSVYREEGVDEADSVLIDIRDSSAWIAANVARDDEVWLKLNCEGSEADIVERLSATGHLAWIDHVLLSLDIERFPGQAHRAHAVIALLDESGVDYTRRETIGYSVRRWLEPLQGRVPAAKRVGYWWGTHLRPDRRPRRVARRALGPNRYDRLADRFGPSRRS